MARNKTRRADVEALKALHQTGIIDTRPLMIKVMRACGVTYAEICEVFGISRQRAETISKREIDRD